MADATATVRTFAYVPSVSADKPVNVASVPQRSLFRYPGGKSWLVPQIRAWLGSLPDKPAHLVEAFAGGASVGLAAAAENLVDRVTLVELDPAVAVVWQVALHGDADGLAARICDFNMTVEAVRAELSRTPTSDVDRAFQTILRNRVQRAGIMAPGAGLMRAGERGRGIGSRWYPETLAHRIAALSGYADRVTVVCGDAFDSIAAARVCKDTAIFADPPYVAGGKRAGSRLYGASACNHAELFDVASQCAGDVLLTYDDTVEVRKLADVYGLATRRIAMRSAHNAHLSELLIGRNLAWVL